MADLDHGPEPGTDPGTGASLSRLFAVDGLFCAGCARGLETRLSRLEGVMTAGVHYVSGTALVRWDPGLCDVDAIAGCVRSAGYRSQAYRDPGDIVERLDRAMRTLGLRLVIAVAFGMWSMAAALVLYLDPGLPERTAWVIALASGLLALPVAIYSGADILRMAVRSVRLGAPGVDLLIALGTAGALTASLVALAQGRAEVYFDTATMLISLLLVGRLIETRARLAAARASAALGDAFADQAILQQADGSWSAVASADLGPGDRVRVQAGSVATIDGVICEGRGALDTSVLTGESTPRAVGPGDRISAGYLNLNRALVVVVDRKLGDRDVDRMGGRIALEIAARGEPDDRIGQVASTLTRLIPLLAVIVALGTIVATGSILDGLMRGLLVMVVACPCALALAAPLGQMRAMAVAERIGFRIADASAFARMAGLRTVIFDKTGTLTLGRPRVDSIEPRAGWTADTVLALAAQAETGIDHPLAEAILDHHGGPSGPGGERDGRQVQTTDVDGHLIRVGASPAALPKEGLPSARGRTRLTVWRDEVAIGDLTLVDALDPQALSAIDRLRRRGLVLWLATGDGEGPARHVAEATGIGAERIRWGCTPLSKAALARELPGPVMVVGDGVNDGPALAAADCGVSVSRAHPAASATAALVLTHGGLETLPLAVDLAIQTRSRLRQNIALALAYNVVALPAAALGLLTPAGAALAMVVSSIAVTVNATRLRTPASPDHHAAPGDQSRVLAAGQVAEPSGGRAAGRSLALTASP